MNICAEKLYLAFTEIKKEGDRIKVYAQRRYVAITSEIKAHPITTSVSCLLMAWCIYWFAIPIFSLSLVYAGLVVRDYLDNFYFTAPPPGKGIDTSKLFNTLRKISNQPISTKDEGTYKYLKADSEETWDRARRAYEISSRPVFLFLKAKSDPNGAFKDRAIRLPANCNVNDKPVSQTFFKNYKTVLIENVATIDDIKKALVKITNTIQHVWILAHGSPTSILLDGNSCITKDNIDELTELMQQKISKDAHVVLVSCNTGEDISPDKNIATRFSEILPDRTIFAPKTVASTCLTTIDLGANFSVNGVAFSHILTRSAYLKEKVWNICCLQPFKKIEICSNITTVIRNGKIVQC